MFAAYVYTIHVHCVGMCGFSTVSIIFIITRAWINALVIAITIIFYLCCLLISRKAKIVGFSASKPRPSRMRSSQAHLEAGQVIYSY